MPVRTALGFQEFTFTVLGGLGGSCCAFCLCLLCLMHLGTKVGATEASEGKQSGTHPPSGLCSLSAPASTSVSSPAKWNYTRLAVAPREERFEEA